MQTQDLSQHQQRALGRLIDRAGPDNHWVAASRLSSLQVLESLVAAGFLVAKVHHDNKGHHHFYRLRKDAPDAA